MEPKLCCLETRRERKLLHKYGPRLATAVTSTMKLPLVTLRLLLLHLVRSFRGLLQSGTPQLLAGEVCVDLAPLRQSRLELELVKF